MYNRNRTKHEQTADALSRHYIVTGIPVCSNTFYHVLEEEIYHRASYSNARAT